MTWFSKNPPQLGAGNCVLISKLNPVILENYITNCQGKVLLAYFCDFMNRPSNWFEGLKCLKKVFEEHSTAKKFSDWNLTGTIRADSFEEIRVWLSNSVLTSSNYLRSRSFSFRTLENKKWCQNRIGSQQPKVVELVFDGENPAGSFGNFCAWICKLLFLIFDKNDTNSRILFIGKQMQGATRMTSLLKHFPEIKKICGLIFWRIKNILLTSGFGFINHWRIDASSWKEYNILERKFTVENLLIETLIEEIRPIASA